MSGIIATHPNPISKEAIRMRSSVKLSWTALVSLMKASTRVVFVLVVRIA